MIVENYLKKENLILFSLIFAFATPSILYPLAANCSTAIEKHFIFFLSK